MKVWELFPDLTTAVFQSHEHRARPVRGHHDFYHAVRVGQMACRVSEDEASAQLAGAAGLCHNADRILQADLGLVEQQPPPDQSVEALVRDWLAREPRLPDADHGAIARAVLLHTRPNEDADDPVTIALKDADRLVNTGADDLLRLGQFFPGMLTVDLAASFDNPAAAFRRPGSVFQAIRFQLEWTEAGGKFGLRLPKSLEIAARRRAFYEWFVREELEQLREEGFSPFPDSLPRIDPWQ